MQDQNDFSCPKQRYSRLHLLSCSVTSSVTTPAIAHVKSPCSVQLIPMLLSCLSVTLTLSPPTIHPTLASARPYLFAFLAIAAILQASSRLRLPLFS